MPRIYSVDRVLKENKPYVELRGKYYEVRDFTVRERLENIMEFMKKEEERAEEVTEEGEELPFDKAQDIIANAIQKALVGVPEEVAKSITEHEWQILKKTIQEIQEAEFPVDVRDEDEIDPSMVGKSSD